MTPLAETKKVEQVQSKVMFIFPPNYANEPSLNIII